MQTAQSLDEGMRVLVHLDTTDVAFENNNLRLVYLQGQLSSEEVCVFIFLFVKNKICAK